MEPLVIAKIGGSVIDDSKQLAGFLESFAKLDGYKILVHGGGKIATDIGYKMGIEPVYIEGRRVTDEQTLKLVTKVYGGLVNKNLVAWLQSLGCNAIGLTGADANLIQAHKRSVEDIDYGFVGDVPEGGVNKLALRVLLDGMMVPVLAPLTHDSNGTILNTNADTIAQEVAKAMSGQYNVQLIYSFEKRGVLRDIEDDSSVIPTITKNDFEQMLANNTVFEGMIPKLYNAFAAINHGVTKVTIGRAEEFAELVAGKSGTNILQ